MRSLATLSLADVTDAMRGFRRCLEQLTSIYDGTGAAIVAAAPGGLGAAHPWTTGAIGADGSAGRQPVTAFARGGPLGDEKGCAGETVDGIDRRAAGGAAEPGQRRVRGCRRGGYRRGRRVAGAIAPRRDGGGTPQRGVRAAVGTSADLEGDRCGVEGGGQGRQRAAADRGVDCRGHR